MGYGGALIWTGLARNLKHRWPEAKVIFVHKYVWSSFTRRYPFNDAVIFDNNPDIDLVIDRWRWWWRQRHYRGHKVIVVDIHNPAYHYWVSDTPAKVTYKTGQHAIQFACDVHHIAHARLQPRLELTAEEMAAAGAVLAKHNLTPGSYLCLEPHTKEEFTPNKAWFWERWETFAHEFSERHPEIPLVQVGAPGSRPLPGTINLCGATSFRATGGVLREAVGLVSCLGGLTHLNKAMGKRSVVLVSAWEPKELASYPDDFNLYTAMDCQCAGLKTPCPIGRESMRRIQVSDVLAATEQLLAAHNRD